MINIVIPMAGLGSRFSKAGYEKPKPFIDVDGKPMIVRVLENLNYPNAHYILLGRSEHLLKEVDLVDQIKRTKNATFVQIDNLTEGTACTVLHARELINNNTPLLIANSDQIIDIDISDYISDALARDLDGSILTFIDEHRDPKWSFAKLDKSGFVAEVKEKVAISENATVGVYFFKTGRSFVNGAVDMIVRNERVNNEFYTCPVYNYLIDTGSKIGIYNIDQNKMHGIGTPDDLNNYLRILRNAG